MFLKIKASWFEYKINPSFLEEKMLSGGTKNILFFPISRNTDRQLSVLEGRSRNVVYLDHDSLGRAVKAPATIGEADEGVSGRAARFMIEFADILLGFAKHQDR